VSIQLLTVKCTIISTSSRVLLTVHSLLPGRDFGTVGPHTSANLGHVQSASNVIFLAAAKSGCSLDGKQQKQQSLKIDLASVIDVNKNKHVGNRELTNQHLF